MWKIALVALIAGLAFFSWPRFDPVSVLNQRVLITGASSGIGEQLAYHYARLGAKLVLTARREALLQNVSKTCEDLGASQVHYVAADMSEEKDRTRLMARVEEHLQGLDHLILNHAVLASDWWGGGNEDMAALKRVLGINFLSYVDLASKALPMLTANRGRIGVVSSITGRFGAVRTTVYSACKFALNGFFSSLRQELRHKDTGVTVTIAVLGPIATDTFMDIKGQNHSHLPDNICATPEAAARAILEHVAMRSYGFNFDWKINFLLQLNAVAPDLVEDTMSNVQLNKRETWLTRMTLFIMGFWFSFSELVEVGFGFSVPL